MVGRGRVGSNGRHCSDLDGGALRLHDTRDVALGIWARVRSVGEHKDRITASMTAAGDPEAHLTARSHLLTGLVGPRDVDTLNLWFLEIPRWHKDPIAPPPAGSAAQGTARSCGTSATGEAFSSWTALPTPEQLGIHCGTLFVTGLDRRLRAIRIFGCPERGVRSGTLWKDEEQKAYRYGGQNGDLAYPGNMSPTTASVGR